MRIQITIALLLLDRTSAFGVSRSVGSSSRPTNNNSQQSSSSSLYAVDVLVDAIANGGSSIVDAATAAAASIAPAAESLTNTVTATIAPAAESLTNTVTASFSTSTEQLLNNKMITNAINTIDEVVDIEAVTELVKVNLAPDSAIAAGTAFGAGGFLVGSLTTGASRNAEAKRLEKIVNEKTKEIDTLNANLKTVKDNQTKAETETEEAIAKLEDRIFLMDQEFEESTESLKQDFEQRIKTELKTRGEKIEQDLGFKYEIKMMREREQMLQEKLAFVASESESSASKQKENALTKLELAKKRSEVVILQNDLTQSNDEKQQLRDMIEKGSKINPFSVAGYKLQVTDLQTDLSEMEAVLLEREEQIRESKRELEELKTKRSNPLYFVKEIFQ